jgi:hypothetical protein
MKKDEASSIQSSFEDSVKSAFAEKRPGIHLTRHNELDDDDID